MTRTDAFPDAHQSSNLEALTRIQQEVAASDIDIEHVRQQIVETVLSVTKADAAVIEEVEQDELVYRNAAGTAAPHVGTRVPLAHSASGWACRYRSSLCIEDTRLDERVASVQAEAVGFRSGVIVPLIHEHCIYGVLKVYADQPDRFSQEHRALLELASGVLAANLYKATEYGAAESRRALLLDALPVLVAYVDTDLHYQEANSAYIEFNNLNPRSFRGQSVNELMPHARYERLRPYLDAARRGESVSFEEYLSAADGSLRLLRGTYTPNLNQGEVVGFYKILQDVTEEYDAQTDYLTGLKNRRSFERHAGPMLALHRRENRPISLVMTDLDHFKRINDDLGHLVGDQVLRTIGQIIREIGRESDILGRYGGEEFTLLLADADQEGAKTMAERLRQMVADHDFDIDRQVTMSIGIAATSPYTQSVHDLQHEADQALYRAKNSGRNRTSD